jgi:hypothetical protein
LLQAERFYGAECCLLTTPSSCEATAGSEDAKLPSPVVPGMPGSRSLKKQIACAAAIRYAAEGLCGSAAIRAPQRPRHCAAFASGKSSGRPPCWQVTSVDLLDYSDLFDLLTMSEEDWSRVAPALGKGKEVLSLLKRLDDLRNNVAHGRQLVPFEVHLFAGIAGDIRNRVTIYMSTQDPSGNNFPRIESVTDEFGNVLKGSLTLRTSNPLCDTRLTLGGRPRALRVSRDRSPGPPTEVDAPETPRFDGRHLGRRQRQ